VNAAAAVPLTSTAISSRSKYSLSQRGVSPSFDSPEFFCQHVLKHGLVERQVRDQRAILLLARRRRHFSGTRARANPTRSKKATTKAHATCLE
jgi:hypothetical protein